MLATLLDRAAESPTASPETVSNKEARPEFPQAVVPATLEHLLRAPQVTVEVYTPDIRHEDLRKLHGEIRQAWAALHSSAWEGVGRIREEARRSARDRGRERDRERVFSVSQPPRIPTPRGRFTDYDRCLREILENMGGVPDMPPADFWKRVDERWVEEGYPSKNPDVHRRHHARMKSKPIPLTPRGMVP